MNPGIAAAIARPVRVKVKGEKAYNSNGATNSKQISKLPSNGMKFHLETSDKNLFTGHGPGYLAVNGMRLNTHLVVSAEQVLQWDIPDFTALDSRHFESLLAHGPEIVILGTGSTQQFPHPALAQPLYAAGVGLEVMDTRAACRTYNILCAEGRKVVAAVLIG